jgi:ornithine cyclodeaminase/alanine dehydrogenase-like protein (mu-crystallin family)
MAAVGRGLVAEDDLAEIGGVGADWAASRHPDAITVFKSVGLAVQDVAAAELIADRLLGRAGRA